MKNIKRAYITGATGAVGMALVKQCIENDIDAYVIMRPDSGRADRIPQSDKVHVIKATLDELVCLDEKIFEKSDTEPESAFFHLAWMGTTGDARNDMDMQNKNVEYALDAVTLASKLKCAVYVGAGSQAEYGRVEGCLCPDTPTHPENGYGIAKLRAGEETRIRCNQLGLRHIWVRILSVYGPYDNERSVIISTIRRLLAGETPPLTLGEQMWDFMYSMDAAKAMMALASKAMTDEKVSGKVYPLGSGVAAPLKNYIEQLKDAIDPRLNLGFGEVPYGPKQVMHLQADITALKEATGYVPDTSFSDGIKETIRWCKNV